ncbi:MAG: YicC/YloC family endoribonuclease [Candidatus Cloacimonadaceae bacterium]|nr:YicC/YloC family endoribonuclease [Candidatus Cloacimonadaceae bacterium]MDP3114645.1 YicC/YloC family endoribonuclease [Candidatus Cloacimonadaceae bacterium]
MLCKLAYADPKKLADKYLSPITDEYNGDQMRSMTGYGKAKYSENDIDLEIEMKSVNGRYLDMKLYLPRELSFFEYPVRNRISSSLSRGSVEFRLNYSDHREIPLALNEKRLLSYHALAIKAKKALGYEEPVSLEFLLNEPGVIENINQLDEDTILKDALYSTLNYALAALHQSMQQEAAGMKDVLIASVQSIEVALSEIETHIQPFKAELLENMTNRIKDLISTYQLDNMEQRLMQEMAIYVDKYDIQEEITRLRSHSETLLKALSGHEHKDIGKSLNFITQEMQREANTLGSKFSTSNTFQYVLVIKEEIEKCREIVQNVA